MSVVKGRITGMRVSFVLDVYIVIVVIKNYSLRVRCVRLPFICGGLGVLREELFCSLVEDPGLVTLPLVVRGVAGPRRRGVVGICERGLHPASLWLFYFTP